MSVHRRDRDIEALFALDPNQFEAALERLGRMDDSARDETLHKERVITLADTIVTLFLFIILAVAKGDRQSQVPVLILIGFVVSAIRNRNAYHMAGHFDLRASSDVISIADAEREWQRNLRHQRFSIWTICFCSTVEMIIISPSTAILAYTSGSHLVLLEVIVLLAFFVSNAGIGIFSGIILYRARRCGYTNLLAPRSHFMRPRGVRVSKYEDILPKLQAAAAASTGSSSQEEANHQSSCVICLLEYQGPDEVAELPCGHCFHDACARLWFARQPRCPYRCVESEQAIADSIGASTGDMHLGVPQPNAGESQHDTDRDMANVDVDEQRGIVESYETADQGFSHDADTVLPTADPHDSWTDHNSSSLQTTENTHRGSSETTENTHRGSSEENAGNGDTTAVPECDLLEIHEI